MTVSNGNVLRVACIFRTSAGDMIQNTYFFRCDLANAQTDANMTTAISQYLYNVYNTFGYDIRANIDPREMTIDVVSFIDGSWKQVYQVYNGPWLNPPATTGSTATLPTGVAAVVNMKTSQGRHQGRKYIGGLTEGASTVDGMLEGQSMTRLTNGFAKFLTPYVISAGNEIVSVVANTTQNILYEVSSILTTFVFGYQRRRKPGRGS